MTSQYTVFDFVSTKGKWDGRWGGLLIIHKAPIFVPRGGVEQLLFNSSRVRLIITPRQLYQNGCCWYQNFKISLGCGIIVAVSLLLPIRVRPIDEVMRRKYDLHAVIRIHSRYTYIGTPSRRQMRSCRNLRERKEYSKACSSCLPPHCATPEGRSSYVCVLQVYYPHKRKAFPLWRLHISTMDQVDAA